MKEPLSVFNTLVLSGIISAVLCGQAVASSHAEAPFIKSRPKVDATDFYLFNSYEPG
jgi:hypothetical protein